MLKFSDAPGLFTVTCYVSKDAKPGFALEQTDELSRHRPVASGSRKLNEKGTKYSAAKLEHLDTVEALKAYLSIFTRYRIHSIHRLQCPAFLLTKHNLEGCPGRQIHRVS